jgi:uncharacterized protein YndB with AHSA1/START domain
MTDTTISKSIFLSAPREAVWSYLTEKEKLGLWFYAAENDLVEKQPYTLISKSEDGTTSKMCWGDVLEMKKPARLVYTFTIKPLGGAMTKIIWTLEDVLGGTKLVLVHEGLGEAAGEAAMGLLLALDEGWDKHLAKLRPAAA